MSAIEIKFTGSRWAVYVAGSGAYRMLRSLRAGQPPHFDRTRRRYVVTESIAGDLLALAEAEGRRTVIHGLPEQPVDQGRLW